MTQLLASLRDISKHLPNDKVQPNDANTSEWQIEADRIVKAKLSGVFSAVTLHSWNSPDNTPGLIRSIAGQLIAAYLYRSLYSEDATDIPEYAQTLYDGAIAQLDMIIDGSLTVLDADDVPVPKAEGGLVLGDLDFFPNDAAPGPFFKMADRW